MEGELRLILHIYMFHVRIIILLHWSQFFYLIYSNSTSKAESVCLCVFIYLVYKLALDHVFMIKYLQCSRHRVKL